MRGFSKCFLSCSSSLLHDIVYGTLAYEMGHSWAGQLETTPPGLPIPPSRPGDSMKLSSMDQGSQPVSHSARLGTSFACGNSLERAFGYLSPCVSGCQEQSFPRRHECTFLTTGLFGWVGSPNPALNCGLPWCSFWCLTPPPSAGLPGVAGRRCRTVAVGDVSLGSLTLAGCLLITFCFVH